MVDSTVEWDWQKTLSLRENKKGASEHTMSDDEISSILDNHGSRMPMFGHRADAKWGAFFDYFGIKYQYERGSQNNSVFRLNDFSLMMQVVPNVQNAIDKYPSKLRQSAVLFSEPRVPRGTKSGGVRLNFINGFFKSEGYYMWYECPYCRKIGIMKHNQKVLPCCKEERELDAYSDTYGLFFSAYLLSGFSAAERARFAESRASGIISDVYY
jgi:hypothetical protein